MATFESKSVTLDTLLTLFAGLALASCQKSTPDATAEKPVAANAAIQKTAASAAVGAQEVPKAAGSAEKAGGCSPGGCAPGSCGASKKK